jgi:hypothetical protein
MIWEAEGRRRLEEEEDLEDLEEELRDEGAGTRRATV